MHGSHGFKISLSNYYQHTNVRYSFSEDTKEQKDAVVENYLKELVVDKLKAKRGEVEGQTLVQQTIDGSKSGSIWGLVGVIAGPILAGEAILLLLLL